MRHNMFGRLLSVAVAAAMVGASACSDDAGPDEAAYDGGALGDCVGSAPVEGAACNAADSCVISRCDQDQPVQEAICQSGKVRIRRVGFCELPGNLDGGFGLDAMVSDGSRPDSSVDGSTDGSR